MPSAAAGTFRRLIALPAALRVAVGVALVLGLAGLGIALGLRDLHQQLLLLAAVLAAALLLGAAAGLAGATAGFAALVWRGLEETGGEGGGGWSLGLPALLDAFLWFALAKLSAALVAAPRGLVARLAAAREEAEAEARQRALLMGEMSHRVMNDLQRLAGLLQSQARADPAAAGPLRAAAGRVQVLGRLHHRLSVRGGGAEADSRLYIEAVVEDLRAGLAGAAPVALTVAAESHPLPVGAAGDLGLVLNELVTNALKHAFPGGRAGTVRVAFRREADGLFALEVADNGVGARGGNGLAEAAGGRGEAGGFGRRLVRALAAQLGGRTEAASGEVGGTTVTLRFPPPGREPEPAGGLGDHDGTEAAAGAPRDAGAARPGAAGGGR